MAAPTVMSHPEAMVLAAGRQLRRARARTAELRAEHREAVAAEVAAEEKLAAAQAEHTAAAIRNPEQQMTEIRRLSALRRSLIESKGGAR